METKRSEEGDERGIERVHQERDSWCPFLKSTWRLQTLHLWKACHSPAMAAGYVGPKQRLKNCIDWPNILTGLKECVEV